MIIRIEGIEVSITAGKYQRDENSTWLLPMFGERVKLKRLAYMYGGPVTAQEKAGLLDAISNAIDKINDEFERKKGGKK